MFSLAGQQAGMNVWAEADQRPNAGEAKDDQ
jgi:hypothetical protein